MKLLRKIVALALVVMMVASIMPISALAESVVESGSCGSGLTWTLNDKGTLSITGTGAMVNYSPTSAPWYSRRNNIVKVTIADGVTSIGSYAFSNCSGLESVTIPDSVISIGDSAFYYCSSLESINVYSGNKNFSSENGVLFDKNKTKIICYPAQKAGSHYSIPDSVTSIGDSAFYYCSSLESVTIPDSVTSIGRSAFDGCSSLKSITIPDSVTSISSGAFEGCSSLTSVTIPDSVTSVESWAFYYCSSLETVYYAGNEQQWNNISIGSGNTALLNATIHFPKKPEISMNKDKIELEVGESTIFVASIVAEDDEKRVITATVEDESIVEVKPILMGDVDNNGVVDDADKTLITNIIIRSEDYPQDERTLIAADMDLDGKITSIDTLYIAYITVGRYEHTKSVAFELKGLKGGKTSILTEIQGEGVTACCDVTVSKIVVASGECGANGDNLTWTLDEDGTLSITGTGAMKDYDAAGAAPWYSRQDSIVKVTIADGVTGIGAYTFSDCSSIESVTIPDSVTSIGEGAFWRCSNLKNIELPDSVTSIGDDAFMFCSSLVSITIPDGVTSVGSWAFSDCSSLVSVTIPDSVTSIGNSAFMFCSSLVSVTIPDSVTRIGDYAFYNCNNLADVYYKGTEEQWNNISIGSNNTPLLNATIHFVEEPKVIASGECGANGDNLTWTLDDEGTLSITGTGAMKDYLYGHAPWYSRSDSIVKVTIADGVTSIGSSAFSNCDSLESVTIGDSVTSIGHGTFHVCSSLESITIPDSVTSIGDGAFGECSSLVSVAIGDGVTSIGEGAFEYCFSLESINVYSGNKNFSSENGVLFDKNKTKIICYPEGKTGSHYSIPDSVTSIERGAFYYCSSLESVTIPGSVTSIGNWAFFYCSSLESVTIPDSVTSIGEDAFRGCSSLVGVTIGDSVTSIGDSAFFECSSLVSVTIGDSVTSIGDWAFFDCSSLETVYYTGTKEQWNNISINSTNKSLLNATIHFVEEPKTSGSCGTNVKWSLDSNGTLSITGTGAMEDYSYYSRVPWYSKRDSIVKVTIADGVTSIGSEAFSNCGSLVSITIPDSVTSIGNSAFDECSSLKSVTIPDSVTSIRDYAFCGCSGLESVTIPDSVTSIWDSAFNGCSSLKSVTIPDSVISIGQYAFSYCSSLESVTIPDSVISIDWWAFSRCSSLVSINVNSGNKYFSSENGVLFDKNKTSIICYPEGKAGSHYSIPDSVTSIGYSAFYYCSSLESVTIPDSVTIIGYSAFSGCSSLKSVTIPDSVTSIRSGAFEGCSSLESVTIPDSVTSVENWAFYGCSNLTEVYYTGTEEQWNNISVGPNNTPLINATIHFVEEPEVLKGDVTGDGEIDFTDAIRILKHDAGLETLEGDALVAADVNGDDEVDFVDAIYVLKFDAGLISKFE